MLMFWLMIVAAPSFDPGSPFVFELWRQTNTSGKREAHAVARFICSPTDLQNDGNCPTDDATD